MKYYKIVWEAFFPNMKSYDKRFFVKPGDSKGGTRLSGFWRWLKIIVEARVKTKKN